MRVIEAQTAALATRPNVKLETERKFVFNSYLALHVCRQLLKETGASNFGFSRCMGMSRLRCSAPRLVSSSAWRMTRAIRLTAIRTFRTRCPGCCCAGLPAARHLSAIRIIRMTGIYFVAHCQAPRRMNGRDFEPATILTTMSPTTAPPARPTYTMDQV